jgi:sulfate transport system ATP-binding protein
VVRSKNGGTSIAAAVRHVSSVGPVVRLELERGDTGDLIEAQLTREQFRELGIAAGEQVYVKPRKATVFVEDYSI